TKKANTAAPASSAEAHSPSTRSKRKAVYWIPPSCLRRKPKPSRSPQTSPLSFPLALEHGEKLPHRGRQDFVLFVDRGQWAIKVRIFQAHFGERLLADFLRD